jgi:hypothetical protein
VAGVEQDGGVWYARGVAGVAGVADVADVTSPIPVSNDLVLIVVYFRLQLKPPGDFVVGPIRSKLLGLDIIP